MNRSKHACILLVLAVSTSRLATQEGQSPMPALPPDIPKNATIWLQVTDKTPSGQDAVWTTPDGTIHEFYQFNDRGRGPKTYSTYRVDRHGVIASEDTNGVDYMKNPVKETFEIKNGTATWKNQAEDGRQDNAAGRYFVDLDGGPTSFFRFVKALLTNGNKLSLLPGGEVSLRQLKTIPIAGSARQINATLYAVDGLSFTPA